MPAIQMSVLTTTLMCLQRSSRLERGGEVDSAWRWRSKCVPEKLILFDRNSVMREVRKPIGSFNSSARSRGHGELSHEARDHDGFSIGELPDMVPRSCHFQISEIDDLEK